MESKTSKKKLETNERYLQKLDRITIRVRKDGGDGFTKEQVEARADSLGESVNAYINRLISEDMERVKPAK